MAGPGESAENTDRTNAGWKIPELEVLINEDWLFAVYNNQLQTEKDYQHAFEWLKNGATTRRSSGDGKFPGDLRQETDGHPAANSFFPSPISDIILSQFELAPDGSLHRSRSPNVPK